MKLIKISLLITIIAMMLISVSCKDDGDDNPEENKGKIVLNFDHKLNGSEIDYDTLKYTNAAGNEYLLYEIQYFISNLTVYKDGDAIKLDGWKNIHYVDSDIDESMSWEVYDELEPGDYDSLVFILGIPEEQNESFMYVNQPETNMNWPEYLGGGYHYMKINGKWKDPNSNYLRGFAFHLGPGQYYDNNGDITGFYDLSFKIRDENSNFSVNAGEKTNINIIMNVEEWFQNPNAYDHNVHGGDIMENPPAMELAVENGKTVFEILSE